MVKVSKHDEYQTEIDRLRGLQDKIHENMNKKLKKSYEYLIGKCYRVVDSHASEDEHTYFKVVGIASPTTKEMLFYKAIVIHPSPGYEQISYEGAYKPYYSMKEISNEEYQQTFDRVLSKLKQE